MPKEKIEDEAGCYDVLVGWRPDGDVQLGVETAQGHALTSMLYGDSDALITIGRRLADRLGLEPFAATDGAKDAAEVELGRVVLDIVEGSQSSPGQPSYTGVWSTLGRHQINRLIKTLRRARDAAYGRDE